MRLTERRRHDDDPVPVSAQSTQRVSHQIESRQSAPGRREQVYQLRDVTELVVAGVELRQLGQRLKLRQTRNAVTGHVQHQQRVLQQYNTLHSSLKPLVVAAEIGRRPIGDRRMFW